MVVIYSFIYFKTNTVFGLCNFNFRNEKNGVRKTVSFNFQATSHPGNRRLRQTERNRELAISSEEETLFGGLEHVSGKIIILYKLILVLSLFDHK